MTKLKDLKWEIPGNENPKPGRYLIVSFLVVWGLLFVVVIFLSWLIKNNGL